MINVVRFEMIYDEFRVVVAWPTTIAYKRNGSFRNDRWPSFWYEIWLSFRYQMTVSSKWWWLSFRQGNSFFMTCGPKETVAGRSQKSGLRQGISSPFKSPHVQNKNKHTIDANGDTMPWRKLLSKWHMRIYNFEMIKDAFLFEMSPIDQS